MSNWFVIRADSGPDIGIGHVMRCLAFAEWLSEFGGGFILLTYNKSHFIEHKVAQLNGRIHYLSEDCTKRELPYNHSQWLANTEANDAEQCKKIIDEEILSHQGRKPSFIMVDHYALGLPWEQTLRALSPILVIDDLSDRQHFCDWLVDQTYGKSSSDYKQLVPSTCELLVGTKFSLLRKEFFEEAINCKRVLEKEKNRVLISLGGSDPDNCTLKILSYLEGFEFFDSLIVTVVTSNINKNLESLQNVTKKYCNVGLSINVDNMASLMAKNDLCIGAAGSSAWERCVMSLPTLTVVIADNQAIVAEELAKANAIVNLGHIDTLAPSDFLREFSDLYSNIYKYQSIIDASHQVCDGKGVERVIDKIMGKAYRFTQCRPAEANDINLVYRWQCLPETRKFALNNNTPTESEHIGWMTNKLASLQDYFYIIEAQDRTSENKSTGVVRLDRTSDGSYVVSIYLAPDFYGHGLALKALQWIDDLHKDIDIYATVLKDNIASHKLFVKAGYAKINDNTYHRQIILGNIN